MTRLHALLPALLLLGGCASIDDAPSLAPRVAEAIDPRLPVVDRSLALSVGAELAAALGSLRSRALAAAAKAEPAIAAAGRAASAAGPRESESWIAAQQAISLAITERGAFTAALGDLDALVATRIRTAARLVPQDIAAADALAAELGAIDTRQAAAISQAQSRLQR